MDSLYQELVRISQVHLQRASAAQIRLKKALQAFTYYHAIDQLIDIVNAEKSAYADCERVIKRFFDTRPGTPEDELDNWLQSLDDIVLPITDTLTDARNSIGLYMTTMHLTIQMGTESDPPDYSVNPSWF